MSDDARENRKSHADWWLMTILVFALIALVLLRGVEKKAARSRLESQMKQAEVEQAVLRGEIAELKKTAAQREAEIAERERELRQREAAIAGREDAATERTQSSFQGLLIQQQLMRNLEALKASLPDMTPEVERLAKEHAQLGAERQRLEKENAELRLRLNSPKSAEGR